MRRTLLFDLRLAVALCVFGSMCTSPLAQTLRNGPSETISIRVSEGTTLSFDISPDGRWIVFDLLGQLWLLPAAGGAARPLTDAVQDVAEDSDPSFSPHGHLLVFNGERKGRTGLWQLNLDAGVPRQLTQLENPDGYDGRASWSPDGKLIAFTRLVLRPTRDATHSVIALREMSTGATRELARPDVLGRFVNDPNWSKDGKEIVYVTRAPRSTLGGQVWLVPVAGGQPKPLTDENVQAIAPALSSDGRSLAYFAPDANERMQLWVQDIGNENRSAPVRLTDHKDVTTTRLRWVPNERALLYSADGRLWKVAASGGPPVEIPFTANLSITRKKQTLPPARFPEPGRKEPARGFMGLALSPDGQRIATLALGKLWIVPVGGTPTSVADVPFTATSLVWSPDGSEVAWSAGVADHEDLFATNLTTGATRSLTSLPGRETYPAFSPDGRYLAFVHIQKEEGVLRVIDARAEKVVDASRTRDLGSIGHKWTSSPQWSPESDGLLVSNETTVNEPSFGMFVSLSGERKTLSRFPSAPIFLHWTPQHTIVFVRHDRLWQARFDHSGMLSEPEPIGSSAALYASVANDGSLLFVSDSGLRLRLPNGTERTLGWPISYTPPVEQPLLIRNVRIIDGTGAPITSPRDILIENGRIKRIEAPGAIASKGIQTLDGAGRVAIPGLMDLHAHEYRPDLLPGFLYFGITTIRDQGSSMAPLVAYADAIASGSLPGPRVGYGGFQFYSDWPFDEEQGRGIEPEADADHIARSVSLAQAFGAQHIKTRTFRRWDINARMISEAHRRGMRVTGHCSHLLPLIAAGMDAKEHIGLCEARGDKYLYDDLIQLFRAAHVSVVPTIAYFDLAVRLSERHAALDDDAELKPFLPEQENFRWMTELDAADRKYWTQGEAQSREAALKLARAGINIGTGTDIWQIPTGVHMELEQLVAAGLTPLEAIHAGTGGAAQILGAGKELGTIEVGKWADLVLLDANPLTDIRNTRRIWNIIHNGQVVDRAAILKTIHPK